ncbi:MAG TPA: SprB repeat-containing protein [Bacteroidia bacterium]|nr:SprB repeat-containing protein [Bacteroidia bacterium]HRH07325.1 SprB repeat-containing protein [Bacteroidia bacterium]
MKSTLQIIKKALLIFILYVTQVKAEEFDVQLTPSLYAGGYNISCHGANTGSINLFISGGTAPYTYVWYDGPTVRNRSNLYAGSYKVIVTTSNGLSVTREITLTEPELFQVNLDPVVREGGYNISQFGGSDGTVSASVVGGVPPYTFLWSNGMDFQNIDGLIAGTYTLTVHDATNCIASSSITLAEPTELHVVSISSPKVIGNYNISCGANGSINLVVAGGTPPYSFDWSNGSHDQNLVNLRESGNYSVEISDANTESTRSILHANITITKAPFFNASITPFVYSNNKNTTCNNCNNGIINTAISTSSPGVSPYTYTWNNGSFSQNPNNLGEGSYSVVIKDAAGCSVEKSATIIAPQREDWTMKGNSGTNDTTDFLGTTDQKDFVFKANNIESLRLLSNGGTKFTGNVKLSSLTGGGMLYLDANGYLQSSKVANCAGAIEPIWYNTSAYPNLIYTCSPNTVSIGSNSPGETLDVTGTARISSLGTGNVSNPNRLVQANGIGVLSTIEIPSQLWNKNPNGNDVNYPGSVGINTNSFPNGEALHVSGNSLFNGDGVFNNDVKLNSFTNTTNELVMIDGAKKLYNAPANSIMSEVNYWKTNNNGTDLFHTSGNVGIGTNSPNKLLTVNGDVQLLNDNPNGFNSLQILTGGTIPARRGISIDNDPSGKFNFYINSDQSDASFNFINGKDHTSITPNLLTINSNGKIGIGVDPTSTYPGEYLLYVKKGIRTEKITVELATYWADFVFDNKYSLMAIEEVEKYIAEHKHLPGIPSSTEVKKEGVNVSEMFAKQMQKIEELTLYMIELKKENSVLKEKVGKLESKK